MKKKKTAKQLNLERKFSNALRALWRKAKSMSKRGYIIDITFPEKPKRVTEASIRRIKKVSSQLYKKSEFINPKTGEVLSGEAGRKFERKTVAQKAAETRRRNLARKNAPYDWQIALQWLYGIVEQVNARASVQVSKAIQDIIDSAIVRTSEQAVGLAVVHSKEDIQASIDAIADFSYGAQADKYSYALTNLSMLLGGGAPTASQLSDYESADEDGAYEYRQ